MIKFIETLQWSGHCFQSFYLCHLGTPSMVLVLDIRAGGLKLYNDVPAIHVTIPFFTGHLATHGRPQVSPE